MRHRLAARKRAGLTVAVTRRTSYAPEALLSGDSLAMSAQPASASCLALRREVFSVSLDPSTLIAMGRGFLPVGALVEAGASVVKQAMSMQLETVGGSRANAVLERGQRRARRCRVAAHRARTLNLARAARLGLLRAAPRGIPVAPQALSSTG